MSSIKISAHTNFQIDLTICIVMIVIIMNLIFSETAFAQDQCVKEIEDARQKYFAGQFDEAIVLLDNCIKEGALADTVITKALRYLTEVYMAKNYINQAKESIKKLLNLVPNYEPDVVEHTPAYINMVAEAKEELKAERVEEEKEEPTQLVPTVKKGGKKKWLLIAGAGGIVAVVTGLLKFTIVVGAPPSAAKLPEPPSIPPVP